MARARSDRASGSVARGGARPLPEASEEGTAAAVVRRDAARDGPGAGVKVDATPALAFVPVGVILANAPRSRERMSDAGPRGGVGWGGAETEPP